MVLIAITDDEYGLPCKFTSSKIQQIRKALANKAIFFLRQSSIWSSRDHERFMTDTVPWRETTLVNSVAGLYFPHWPLYCPLEPFWPGFLAFFIEAAVGEGRLMCARILRGLRACDEVGLIQILLWLIGHSCTWFSVHAGLFTWRVELRFGCNF